MNSCKRVHPSDGEGIVGRSTSKASILSQSPSELNVAIMDMLNVRQTPTKCDILCRGNPITDAGKRKQMIKMLSVVMLPVLVITGMTANTFAIAVGNYISSSNVRQLLVFSIELGALLRSIQFERDMSALYVSNIKPETKDFLLQRYPDTDLAVQNLSNWPKGDDIISDMETPERFLSYLNKHRYQLDVYNQSVEAELNFYSNIILVLLKWLYDSVSESSTGSVWKDVVAYQEIIVAKNQDRANVTFESARFYSQIAFDIYNAELAKNPNVSERIEEFRNRIKANNYSRESASIKEAELWFDNMTIYQGVLTRTQNALALTIDKSLAKESQEELKSVITICIVFGVILIVCPLVVFAVYSLTSDIQKYSISIANSTKALNKEKQRTDMLLYQMLPKSIAEMLKRREQVDAEQYNESTIFLSDIVGFTAICAQSSPLQVIDLLGNVYTTFDERIDVHDVYKVETIGDAYMVVSGVPKHNGKRHASEIATMSLDLLRNVKRIEISHLPGIRLKIRIGIHSGPTVAGVIGTKMPRFCLFGETVRIASKMESRGKANRIQISQATRDLLLAIGGFDMEERENDVVRREILNAFPGMTGRTYWLRNVDGLNRRASEHSSSSETEDESCCTEKSGGKFCTI
ncbi:Guanylate cyclase 32E,Guanylate cyclase soluble subunit beta-2,Receptor-type guanylate cyclase gcy-19,Head-specific guanylate cyclase,Retinal guanylyl cyclase 2,Heat-stable enterotoxin receptor,Olfactory guanylyl cyclase GC-D,Atrial natriuretic peptide receptor 2,Receptor-type guanylate cyclase gcy-9,Receptor-type guanylate cyclase Gyc76C,Receptor-type guanylate cyclase gcy-18,Receptor-type guanylate cyclase gcy-28,Receptor-type guanylate cyclase daf-11,Speract receptor,Receptor-type guanylate cyclase gcy-|uniref:guanylate cyclase n=1 Tax=Mytilus coruscus TaxID=42192 RepID=A0A6J8DD70_MYTCO|nr:Guanylate cyclase 32E,Guanylate cyclase soluble subunit beta-2,Receptor-type guanylate cyclase gcy-19,Head-specific guanylate cyclase,Retinal guanylyl cyclase 2,Heat-stable enterotoxin receptor,Olfactory guanylyl cyclase GC-D,Atrial natriuretic peptide receptor 2,Receptor-type guanylate cyclase gcy-9,Receptor-type guanylate cyclase Gyc76C,Receptor-type guanylate cyclase gcy-18,Receptor-type guanylate cyclase gcy-28,Receptor-type guanylate cyclase daf-11,Speract receptor,Receptor-type guanylate c